MWVGLTTTTEETATAAIIRFRLISICRWRIRDRVIGSPSDWRYSSFTSWRVIIIPLRTRRRWKA